MSYTWCCVVIILSFLWSNTLLFIEFVVYFSHINVVYMVKYWYIHVIFFVLSVLCSCRIMAGKAFAWRLLGMMPSISKAATVAQSDGWRSDRRTRLDHSCVDILAQQINDLIGRAMFFRFGDQKYRRSRVFLDFDVWTGTRCPTKQCVLQHSKRVLGV
jgi:hypothetical protein